MNSTQQLPRCVNALLIALLILSKTHAITANLGAARDNTLYESETGHLSNGSGPGFFAGVTGQNRTTRGLIQFDIGGELPANATVLSATLTLHASTVVSTSLEAIELRRVSSDWGEGGSTGNLGGGGGGAGGLAEPGDATWLHRFTASSFWTNVGGDFVDTTSATQSVEDVGFYNWTSDQLALDVQDMLDSPNGNFGWILLGNEVNGDTAKRFDTREHPIALNRPMLTVEYDAPGDGLAANFDGDDDVDGDDLAIWAGAYGSTSAGDTDGDNDTDGGDYLTWQQEYTGPVSIAVATVPEPTSAILAFLGLALLGTNRSHEPQSC